MKAEAVMDQLNLEIEELEKERKLAFFIFAIFSFPAVILTLLMATVFAGEYYLADTFAFFLPLAFASAFIGVFLFVLQLKSINNRIMKIKQNEH